MSGQKRNEFLDNDESDDDQQSQGYNSEEEDLQKGRSAKRRKVESDVSDESDDDGGDVPAADDEHPDILADQDEAASPPATKSKPLLDDGELPGISRPLTKQNLVSSTAAIKRSGVLYLSRIPPFMKPSKLRALLEPYGALNRIFLTPEDGSAHAARVRAGGNKKRSFVDGWVEFLDKRAARAAVDLLNTRPVGGKKGSYYHDDVWSLKYLTGFKWHHLTQQIAAENAERASRMRAEISQATRANKEFVRNVERSKIFGTKEAKLAAKRVTDEATQEAQAPARKTQFKQTAVVTKRTEDSGDQVKRVLSKIF